MQRIYKLHDYSRNDVTVVISPNVFYPQQQCSPDNKTNKFIFNNIAILWMCLSEKIPIAATIHLPF
jgi:hypothetical protein